MGRPKALLPLDGESFADRLVGTFAICCEPVILVLGHHHDQIQAGLRRKPQIVLNPDPERGQLSSMQCGLRALPASAAGFVFTPVDYPSIQPGTVKALLAALEKSEAQCAIPRYDGRKGHPVACRIGLAAEFLALPADGQAREVVRRHAAATLWVDVDDPGIVDDVDDPAAYQRLLAEVRPS
jgi:molybdenum cofactor cytidylyltransferase